MQVDPSYRIRLPRLKLPTFDGSEAWADGDDLADPLFMSRFLTAQCERVMEADLSPERKAEGIRVMTVGIEPVEPERALEWLRTALELNPGLPVKQRIRRLEKLLRARG